MRVGPIPVPPGKKLARALEDFERQFTYPLGENASFRISHGEDYTRFYRAIGESVVFAAEHGEEVLGTLGGALRGLVTPDGEEKRVLYLGDLKVRPGWDAGLTLLRLAHAMKMWAEGRAAAAFGIAMDGTPKTPECYTGRFGIARFAAVGKIMVLRLPCETRRARAASKDGWSVYRDLSAGGYSAVGGTPSERSSIEPSWIVLESGRACGMLEDTRRAKRLFTAEGAEMLSAHLSFFAFADAAAGADLLRRATAMAASVGLPALFCSVPYERAQTLVDALGEARPTLAPATLYAAGIAEGYRWHMNTSEI